MSRGAEDKLPAFILRLPVVGANKLNNETANGIGV